MSKSNVKIPFKSSNNKNSPLNMNEIDINLLMQNPKHIHKMMGKNVEDNCEDDMSNNSKYMRNSNAHSTDNVDKMTSEILKKYMNKYRSKSENDTNRNVRTPKKSMINRWGDKIDRWGDNMNDFRDTVYDEVSNAYTRFKKDSEERGFRNTVNNRKDLIGDFIHNSDIMIKLDKKLKPSSDFLKKFDSKSETKRKASRDRYSDMEDEDRKIRLKQWRDEPSKK